MELPYWKMQAADVLQQLQTDAKVGLSSKEAAQRQKQYGKNNIPEKDKRSTIDILISQFNNPFVFILFFATIIAFFLGEIIQAGTIMAVLILSAVLGFYQEYQSENAIRELKKYLFHRALVLRDGQQLEINAADLVPGDIVTIHIGSIVPADLRLLREEDLRMNESALTGESEEVAKSIAPLQLANPQPYQLGNCALMGTTVTHGIAHGVVTAIGTDTYFGKTVTLLSAKVPESDFQVSMRKFSEMIMKVIAVMVVVVFASNTLLNHGMFESLLFALAVAVGIAPEMLPVITTISLSNGALAMAKKKVVIKKLASIEDIGNMDVLCMDKTGTLTEPFMEMEGAVTPEGSPADGELLVYGLLCSNAHVKGKNASGNIFDVALWKYAKINGEPASYRSYAQLDDVEFDFERKRMSEIVQRGSELRMITKGEPASILSICSKVLIHGKEKPLAASKKVIQEKVRWFAKQGYSPIAVATKKVKKKDDYAAEDEKELTLLGFLLFKSQPKKSAATSIAEFRELGITLKLITGDDAAVTARLCKDVGLDVSAGVLTGSEIEKMNDEKLQTAVEKYNVFARVTPAQKVLLISTLRKNGHLVGFLGDGVNDAPALRLADIGISVNTALDVAREAADVVLLAKSLSAIAEGVKEGRRTFGNITKYILNTISANFGNMFTVVVSSFFLPFIPLLPVQILLNNFLSDIPLVTVSTDNVDERFIRQPKRWNVDMITKFMVIFGFISAIFDMLTIVIFYWYFGLAAPLFRTLWFVESSLSEIFVTFVIRTKLPFYKSMPSRLLLVSSLFTAVVVVLITLMPALGNYFGFVPPTSQQLLIVGGIVLAYCIFTEVFKHLFFSYFKEFSKHY
ncbi:MAG: magnesium-translocating P-type ATPase [Candidatus Micrarchaeota archaeon]